MTAEFNLPGRFSAVLSSLFLSHDAEWPSAVVEGSILLTEMVLFCALSRDKVVLFSRYGRVFVHTHSSMMMMVEDRKKRRAESSGHGSHLGDDK